MLPVTPRWSRSWTRGGRPIGLRAGRGWRGGGTLPPALARAIEEPALPSTAPPLRRRRLALPTAWYLVVLGLSSVPASGFERLRLPVDLSLLAHAVEYGVLGAALAWALDGSRWRVPTAVAVAAVGGALDEGWQATVPGRDPSLLDWGVDVVAAAVGAALAVRVLTPRQEAQGPRSRRR